MITDGTCLEGLQHIPDNKQGKAKSGADKNARPSKPVQVAIKPAKKTTKQQVSATPKRAVVRLDKDLSSMLREENIRVPKSEWNDFKRELMVLKQQLLAVKQEQKNAVQRIGAGLTGTIAKLIHMFCDPSQQRMCVPSDDLASVVAIDWLPETSIDLTGGKSNIIVTPTGPYQFYKSIATTLSLLRQFQEPALFIKQLDNAVSPVKILRYDNPDLQTALFQTSGDHFAFTPTQHCSLVANIPQELQGCDITVTLDNNTLLVVNGVESGPFIFTETVAPYNPEVYPSVAIAAGREIVGISYSLDNVTPNLILKVQYERIDDNTGFLAPYNIPDRLTTYYGEKAPNIMNLSVGGVLNAGFINSMSAMVTNDSSSLNNAGLIQAVSVPGILKNPDYMTFNEWISNAKNYRYRGRLRTGAYQIYIPSKYEDLYTASAYENPWMSINAWSMVFLIDNSVSVNGAQLPDKTQCHIVIDGNLQTKALNSVVAPSVTTEDPYYRVAVSLLRRYYNPCCNPDHKDQIAKWIAKTFNGVINRSANYLTSKVTEQNVKSALEKGEKFLSGLMKAEGQSLVWDIGDE